MRFIVGDEEEVGELAAGWLGDLAEFKIVREAFFDEERNGGVGAMHGVTIAGGFEIGNGTRGLTLSAANFFNRGWREYGLGRVRDGWGMVSIGRCSHICGRDDDDVNELRLNAKNAHGMMSFAGSW